MASIRSTKKANKTAAKKATSTKSVTQDIKNEASKVGDTIGHAVLGLVTKTIVKPALNAIYGDAETKESKPKKAASKPKKAQKDI